MNENSNEKLNLSPSGNEMTIYCAEKMKPLLMDGLSRCSELEIDLSLVEEFDSAGFQLLVLVKRESIRLGKTVRLVNHSPAVREMFDFFNMAAHFGDPMVITAREAA